MTYVPTLFVMVVRSRLVSWLCSTTAASAMTAPVESLTVPLIVAVACALALGGEARQANTTKNMNPRRHSFTFVRYFPRVIVVLLATRTQSSFPRHVRTILNLCDIDHRVQ